MQFRTQIPIPVSNRPIDYNSGVVSLGSCFAVNIGDKLNYYKFRNTTNPFGILFHPEALEKFIRFAVANKEFTEADVFYHNERWHCFNAHSDLSNPNKETLLFNLNKAAALAGDEIKKATHILITLGTAWVYRNVGTGNLVANCHKVPQKNFTKELLTVHDIKNNLQEIINHLANVNQGLSKVFTISPVRHIKDGFVENQNSKANLISALQEVLASNRDLKMEYFPSYEIMMDELRDYRFYAEDMIHPSKTAIDYIWERFRTTMISPQAYDVMAVVENIQKGLSHRPFNDNSQQHKEFIAGLRQKIVNLQLQYPHISF